MILSFALSESVEVNVSLKYPKTRNRSGVTLKDKLLHCSYRFVKVALLSYNAVESNFAFATA